MPEYNVHLINPTSTNIRGTADTPEGAAKLAIDEVYAALCHECARQRDDGEWELYTVQDADGEVVLDNSVDRPARRITEPADADKLPVGTLVINDGGQVAQRAEGSGVWWQLLGSSQHWDSETLIGTGWITVLPIPAGAVAE